MGCEKDAFFLSILDKLVDFIQFILTTIVLMHNYYTNDSPAIIDSVNVWMC